MKAYIISIVSSSILIALTQLILQQGKLKTVANTVFSITLLTVMLSPINGGTLTFSIPTFNQTSQDSKLDTSYLNDHFDKRLELYYQTLFKNQLLANDLVVEKIIVEIENMQINKVEIFLSNLVIPSENQHINNIVIEKYVAGVLQIDVNKVQIYV